jgi:hypothetical protein
VTDEIACIGNGRGDAAIHRRKFFKFSAAGSATTGGLTAILAIGRAPAVAIAEQAAFR